MSAQSWAFSVDSVLSLFKWSSPHSLLFRYFCSRRLMELCFSLTMTFRLVIGIIAVFTTKCSFSLAKTG